MSFLVDVVVGDVEVGGDDGVDDDVAAAAEQLEQLVLLASVVVSSEEGTDRDLSPLLAHPCDHLSGMPSTDE